MYFLHTFLSHLIYEFERQSVQGVPDCVKQLEHTRHEDAFNARGALKTAVIQSIPGLNPIVYTSSYNIKQFYMMNTAAPDIIWNKRSMEISTAIIW